MPIMIVISEMPPMKKKCNLGIPSESMPVKRSI